VQARPRPHHRAPISGPRGQDPLTFPNRVRPILDALKNQSLHDEIAAASNLNTDEALEQVMALIGWRSSASA
jgi:hypothetical protein